MSEFLDPVLLSRIQFAFTISFHIIFPAFTIGLASWLAVVEGLWLKTGHPVYKEIYKFWVKIFAVAFGMGVVSGVVMSYQLGTNWSVFSDKVGNVLGPLFGYEVLTAFFLEASFLGIMLFGWNRVGPKMHFASTCIVAVGTLISAFWILSANSWMHTPAGFSLNEEGIFFPENWWAIIFNPSFPYRFMHMVVAAYLTTAFFVGGVAAWYLLKKRFEEHARIIFAMAMIMAVFVSPLQLLLGDLHGLNTFEHQPAKVAAMEGIWENEKGAALRLFAWPDEKTESNKYSIEIPGLASFILTHDWDGEVKGLKNWPANERPPVAPVFYLFRLMVGLGLLMILTGAIALILYFRKALFSTPWFHRLCVAMAPSGFVAVLAGWFVTEIGRQPYIVYGVLRTADSISPVTGAQTAVSLLAFICTYSFVFGAAIYYIVKLLKKGPDTGESRELFGQHGIDKPVTIADVFPFAAGTRGAP